MSNSKFKVGDYVVCKSKHVKELTYDYQYLVVGVPQRLKGEYIEKAGD